MVVVACVLGIAALGGLWGAGTAHAGRHPTPYEKAAIDRAARQAYADRYLRVSVSEIEVSAVDRRWAMAHLALFRKLEPHAPAAQQMEEEFYRTRRGWVAWFSTAMPDVEMPAAVERDLGFPGPATFLGVSTKTLAWIFLGVVALVVLALLGRFLGGESGGQTSGGGGGGRRAVGPSPPQGRGPSRYVPPKVPQKVPCPGGCQGGRVACPQCGWARYVKDPITSEYRPCPTCGCQLFTCPRCHGAGVIDAPG
jgi:hypothetical protein